MLIEFRGLSSNSTCILKAEPVKFDIKIREPGFYLSVYKLVLSSKYSNYDVIIVFLVNSTSFVDDVI